MKRLLLILACLILAGCGPTESKKSTQFTEQWRPKSSLSKTQALVSASFLSSTIPDSQVYAVAETHSMEPILWGNMYVVVESVKIADIRRGDIILWRKTPESQSIIHTCIHNSGTRLTIKGYNNFSGDNQANQFITESNLVGRYIGHVVFDPLK